MGISIRNPRVEQLAREIGKVLNVSMTQAIVEALEEKKARITASTAPEKLRFSLVNKISLSCSSLPDLDSRSADEILGYNSGGFF